MFFLRRISSASPTRAQQPTSPLTSVDNLTKFSREMNRDQLGVSHDGWADDDVEDLSRQEQPQTAKLSSRTFKQISRLLRLADSPVGCSELISHSLVQTVKERLCLLNRVLTNLSSEHSSYCSFFQMGS